MKLIKVLLIAFIMLVMFNFQANSQEPKDRLRIDCGSSNETRISEFDSWLPDENYVKTGINYEVIYSENFSTMNTLRYFPDDQKSCYNLIFYPSEGKFMFRAGFYYGNYDGLFNPPSFNLEIDGNLWATVTTSMDEDEPVYHEMIYRLDGDSSQVCLVRTGSGIPFISSLEAIDLFVPDDYLYRLMETNNALVLQNRINYGANASIGQLVNDDENRNRIWISKEMSGYLNLVSNIIPRGIIHGENEPPWPLLATAIQAKNISDSIYLSVDFSPQNAPVVAYFVLYFRDPIGRYPDNPNGEFQIFIDGKKLGIARVPSRFSNISFIYLVKSLYPVHVHGSANLTISPAKNSTLAPLLNAMEVFSVVNMSFVSKAGYFSNVCLAISLSILHFFAIILSVIQL